MKNSKINVLIIEDDNLWAMFIESIIEIQEEFQLVGVASSINQAQKMMEINRPDLLICDIRLNDLLIFNLFADNNYNEIPTVFMTNELNNENFESARLVKKKHFFSKTISQIHFTFNFRFTT